MIVFSWARCTGIGLALGVVLGAVLHNYAMGIALGILFGAAMRLVQQRRARGEHN
jgi:hypothetical protein